MRMHRTISFILMLLFAVTGLLFLFIPGQVLDFFNILSASFGLSQTPVTGFEFYLILAVGYMYLVTILAFLMFRHPDNKYFVLLLAHGKIASSLLSLAFFLFHAPYLIFVSNFIIDGIIGFVTVYLYFKMKRITQWASY